MKWHPREGEDAKPFSADDVVFTYKIMMHPKTTRRSRCATSSSRGGKAGEHSVVFTLKRPILNALAKFSFKIIPRHGPSNPLF